MYTEARPRSWIYIRWGGGMGWDVNVHVNLQKQLMLRTRGVGWGGMGWDVNVHVNLQKQLLVSTRGVGWGWMGRDVNVHVNLQMMMI